MNPSSFASVPADKPAVKTAVVEFWQNDTLVDTQTYRNGKGSNGQADDQEYDTRLWTERGGGRTIKIVQPTETINTCPERWLDTSAVVSFFGRELCPDCAKAEEAAYDAAQCRAWEEMDFGRHDQMSSLRDVLVGMGF